MKIRITNYESKLWDSLKNIADIIVSRFFISFISIASTMPTPLFFSLNKCSIAKHEIHEIRITYVKGITDVILLFLMKDNQNKRNIIERLISVKMLKKIKQLSQKENEKKKQLFDDDILTKRFFKYNF